MPSRAAKIGGAMVLGVLLLFVGALAIEFDGKWPSGGGSQRTEIVLSDARGLAWPAPRYDFKPIVPLEPIGPLHLDDVYTDRIELPEAPIDPPNRMEFEERALAVHCAVVEGIDLPANYGMGNPSDDAYIHEHVRRRVDEELHKLQPGASRQERIESLWGDLWGVEVFFEPEQCEPLAGLRIP